MGLRTPTIEEVKLIELIIKQSDTKVPGNWKVNLSVKPMDEGGTGSLLLFPTGVVNKNKEYGTCAGGIQFTDTDGVVVIISLNLDTEDELFELNVWKENFSNVIQLPQL